MLGAFHGSDPVHCNPLQAAVARELELELELELQLQVRVQARRGLLWRRLRLKLFWVLLSTYLGCVPDRVAV